MNITPEEHFDTIKKRDFPDETYKAYGFIIYMSFIRKHKQAVYWHRMACVLAGLVCLLLTLKL